MTEPVLQARGIDKRFGAIAALSGVTIDLHGGEIHAVIGPNGAGKSTLLATLAGDLTPDAGAIAFAGAAVTHRSVQDRARRGIGRTYQQSAVIGDFTACDMVRLAALRERPAWSWCRPLAHAPAVTARAEKALAQAGLSERRNTRAATLSHGEKRRLEIAAVLALSPRVLLLDEPLAGLGRGEKDTIVGLVTALRGTCAVMLIEHDMDAVFTVADRITVLHNGRVLASGTPASVRADRSVQEAYLGVPA